MKKNSKKGQQNHYLTKLDKKNMVVLPLQFRKYIGLKKGDPIEIRYSKYQIIIRKPGMTVRKHQEDVKEIQQFCIKQYGFESILEEKN